MRVAVGHICPHCGCETNGQACDACTPPGWFAMLAETASYGWAAPVLLALILHVALAIPLIAGAPGPDGPSIGSDDVAPMQGIAVIDSQTIDRQMQRLPPGLDVAEADGVDLSPRRASLPPDAAAPTQSAARGAALLPFDMLPLPTPAKPPPPPAPKPARVQRADATPAPPPQPRRFATRAPDVEEPEPGPPPVYAYGYPSYYPPPPPPPPPPRRTSRTFWFGIWCSAYIRCD